MGLGVGDVIGGSVLWLGILRLNGTCLILWMIKVSNCGVIYATITWRPSSPPSLLPASTPLSLLLSYGQDVTTVL